MNLKLVVDKAAIFLRKKAKTLFGQKQFVAPTDSDIDESLKRFELDRTATYEDLLAKKHELLEKSRTTIVGPISSQNLYKTDECKRIRRDFEIVDYWFCQTDTLPINADRPIASIKDDALGRTDFALTIARALRGWQGKESLVMAVCGPWGTGKSSVKNMVVERLELFHHNRPKVIEFNPWYWSSQDKLVQAFFAAIKAKLDDARVEYKDEIAADLDTIAAGFETAKTVGEPILNFAKALTLGGLFAVAVSIFQHDVWDVILKIVACVFLLLGFLVSYLADVTPKFAKLLSARAKAEIANLRRAKERLEERLRGIDGVVVVMVDDMDRLAPDELKLLLQLIKANASFPNLVYVLFYQKDVVHDGIGKWMPGSGATFLEKIVQLDFDLPQVDRAQIVDYLQERVENIVRISGLKEKFEKDLVRWEDLLAAGIKDYFKTLRDVNRYLNGLSFHLSLFRSAGALEVNLIDLFALEAIRLFEPRVYEQISQNRDIFAMNDITLAFLKYADEKRKLAAKRVEAIIEQAKSREHVHEVLNHLFPQLIEIVGKGKTSLSESETLEQLRVCNPRVFERYFRLVSHHGDLSQVELEELMSLCKSSKDLYDYVLSLKERNLFEAAIEYLSANINNIDEGEPSEFLKAVFELGDQVPYEPFLLLSSEIRLLRIAHRYAYRFPPAEREKFLEVAYRSSNSIYLPIKLLRSELESTERARHPDKVLISQAFAETLRDICVDKIRERAKSRTLQKEQHLIFILFQWLNWTSRNEVQTWLEDLLSDPNEIPDFLARMIEVAQGTNIEDGKAELSKFIKRETIKSFTDMDYINDRLPKKLDFLSASQIEAIQLFKEAYSRKDGIDEFWEHSSKVMNLPVPPFVETSSICEQCGTQVAGNGIDEKQKVLCSECASN